MWCFPQTVVFSTIVRTLGMGLLLLPFVVVSGCAEPGQRDSQPMLTADQRYPQSREADSRSSGIRQVSGRSFSNSGAKDEQAPETYRVKFTTTAGEFMIEVHRDWSPNGADRFYSLVKHGFFDDCAFFRAVSGFMVQFGIGSTPDKNFGWEDIADDDRASKSNQRGFVTFAKTARPNSRSTQVFINYGNNARLDANGFTPFGKVIGGMEAVDSINQEYGEAPSQLQGVIKQRGNSILQEQFPNLDYILKAQIETPAGVETVGGIQ